MEYTPRVVDRELDELLPGLPAIALDGPKAVGKTETARRRSHTVWQLTNPTHRTLLDADENLLLEGEGPVLIDEWQLRPSLWDVVRHAVDADPHPGRFLLAGSATPQQGSATHTGAGRIVSLRMRPMALCERGFNASVSLIELLRGNAVVGGSTTAGLSEYVEEILSSGFPGIRTLPGRAKTLQLDGYLTRVIDRDIPEQGVVIRRAATLRAWLTAYAAATATTTDYGKILDAATAGTADKPARSTVNIWRDLLERIWMLDPLPAWAPFATPLNRLTGSPKHYLADPALAARLLGLTHATLTGARHPHAGLIGPLFEHLAALTIRTCAQAADATVSHLRTKSGEREVDFIVEGSDGRVVAIEVKLSSNVTSEDVSHLAWLRGLMGQRLAAAVVLNTGPRAYVRSDGVAVVPLSLLGP